MTRAKRYHVYLMASKGRVLYVGMTGFLMARVLQHKTADVDSFTQRYHVHRLVYYETFQYVTNAIARETEDQSSGMGWAEFGAIRLRQHRFKEAEDALRRALEINENAFLWGELGLLLAHDDKRTEEAIVAFRRALAIDATDWFAWSKLLRLKARAGTGQELLSSIEEFFGKLKRSPKAVTLAAWAIHDDGRPELLARAIEWVRGAMAEAPDNWKLSHTLAVLTARTGDWKEAIDVIPAALAACACSERALKHITDFLISAAANGHASEVLTVLQRYGGAAALEPLTIGVRLYLGEQPIVAQEVMDVGEDVAKRIREFNIKVDQNGTNPKKTSQAG